jgi:hypothetical protein
VEVGGPHLDVDAAVLGLDVVVAVGAERHLDEAVGELLQSHRKKYKLKAQPKHANTPSPNSSIYVPTYICMFVRTLYAVYYNVSVVVVNAEVIG